MSEAPDSAAASLAERVIAHHSKSFSLAAKLLPEDTRRDAVLLYAFCRHADDLVDESPPEEQPAALARLRAELDACFSSVTPEPPVLRGFQSVVRRRDLPRLYAEELVEGMAMDVRGERYETLEQLLTYCYRAAGTVGLMMCHVMGVRDDDALYHAAHLGIAMQITNICRDVAEDWERGRLYLPAELLAAHGVTGLDPTAGPLPPSARPAVRATVAQLLRLADRYYRSGDKGLVALDPRSRFAVAAAARVYAGIGRVLARRGHDPLSGRAIVSLPEKLWLVLRAGWTSLRIRPLSTPTRAPARPVLPSPRTLSLPRGAS